VVFDEIAIASYISFEKYINVLALEKASPATGTVPIVSAHSRTLLDIRHILLTVHVTRNRKKTPKYVSVGSLTIADDNAKLP